MLHSLQDIWVTFPVTGGKCPGLTVKRFLQLEGMSFFSPCFYVSASLFLMGKLGHLTWVRHSSCKSSALYPFLTECAIFSCVRTVVWLPAFGIFKVHTDVDACNCTRGLCRHRKKVYGTFLVDRAVQPSWSDCTVSVACKSQWFTVQPNLSDCTVSMACKSQRFRLFKKIIIKKWEGERELIIGNTGFLKERRKKFFLKEERNKEPLLCYINIRCFVCPSCLSLSPVQMTTKWSAAPLSFFLRCSFQIPLLPLDSGLTGHGVVPGADDCVVMVLHSDCADFGHVHLQVHWVQRVSGLTLGIQTGWHSNTDKYAWKELSYFLEMFEYFQFLATDQGQCFLSVLLLPPLATERSEWQCW